METTNPQTWKKCSTCKKDILLGAKYYECSVSTCSGQRTGYVFCSLICWEAHVPGARHRDSAAIEKQAPKAATAQEPARRIIVGQQASTSFSSSLPKEVLVVVSKMKDYIKARADMNTAEGTKDIVSEHIRVLCDDAIDRARAEGRKTVLERDFLPPGKTK